MTLGIFGASTQSGRAFLADLIAQGHTVYGYCRPSDHGREFADAVRGAGGIQLERPPNTNDEASRFVPLGSSDVGHDLTRLVSQSRVVVVSHPSHHHEETVAALCAAGLRARRTPVVLAPSRTLATPYLWNIADPDHPFVCFATSPYSSKAPAPDRVYIKRRKRTWLASLEGRFHQDDVALLAALFPQAIFTRMPAATSLGNIGAVFHPTPYLMNWEAIQAAEDAGEPFSFYVQGIAQRPEVGAVMEEIDQTRLQLSASLGLQVYGLLEDARESEWTAMMSKVRKAEGRAHDNLVLLRRARRRGLHAIHHAVVSAQHWLDHTYGVARIPGESLSAAVGRTPTYQRMSVAQRRYIEEDIPTGLVPLEALAARFGVRHDAITQVLDLFERLTGIAPRLSGRNLVGMGTTFLRTYLQGDLSRN